MVDQPQQRFCVNCGQPLTPGVAFCVACGTQVGTPPVGAPGPDSCWRAAGLSAALHAGSNASTRRSTPHWSCIGLRSQSYGASFSASGQATTFQAARVWLSLTFPGNSCRTIHRFGAYHRRTSPDLHVCGRSNGCDLPGTGLDSDACNQARTRSVVRGLHGGLS